MQHAKKSDWAAAKAAEYRREAQEIPPVIQSDWRGVRARMRRQATLRAEADRYDSIAAAYRRHGK